MKGGWFPRPRTPGDLRPLGASGELGIDELFALLTDPLGHEWHERVAVSSPADGSAKSTTRLLRVGGWVFKTDTSQAERERGGPQARLAKLTRLAHRIDLWHPDKRWLLLRCPDTGLPGQVRDEAWWWPLSVCPELVTLRSLADWPSRSRAWAAALALALDVSQRHGLGLDLGPANFGMRAAPAANELHAAQLWYLDDELYPPLELVDLAQAIVGRIPEEPEIGLDVWQGFGEYLRALLKPRVGDDVAWRELLQVLGDPVLAECFHGRRAALLRGLERGSIALPTLERVGAGRLADTLDDTRDEGRDEAPSSRTRETSSELRTALFAAPELRRTALIADVHANLHALEAVIAAAEAEGVDSWLCLGDVVGYGPQPKACIARVRALPNLLAIRGNHDHMCCFGGEHASNRLARTVLAWTRGVLDEAELRWLMSLPVEHLDDRWQAVHGAPIDPDRFSAYVYTLSYRANLAHLAAGGRTLCFHGHTHVPMIYRIGGPEGAQQQQGTPDLELALEAVPMLINPGSVGQPRDGDRRAAFAIWDRERETLGFRRVAYPVHRTIAELAALGLPDELATRLELGR